jgi:hypothetical protein
MGVTELAPKDDANQKLAAPWEELHLFVPAASNVHGESDLSQLGKFSSVDTTIKKQTRKVRRKQHTGIIMYQLPEVAQIRRVLAAEQNKTQQALLSEGLNAVFTKYGKPPLVS